MEMLPTGARLLLGIYSGIATLDQSTQHFCKVCTCDTVAPSAMEVPTQAELRKLRVVELRQKLNLYMQILRNCGT